nr:hypothetical protein Itr_chr11CG07520 [Ipomoea trifida]
MPSPLHLIVLFIVICHLNSSMATSRGTSMHNSDVPVFAFFDHKIHNSDVSVSAFTDHKTHNSDASVAAFPNRYPPSGPSPRTPNYG